MAGSRKWQWHSLNLNSPDHALCGNPPGLHRTWPYGHSWEPAGSPKINCPECIEIAKNLNDTHG